MTIQSEQHKGKSPYAKQKKRRISYDNVPLNKKSEGMDPTRDNIRNFNKRHGIGNKNGEVVLKNRFSDTSMFFEDA